MRKTTFWIVTASLLFSLMIGAAVGRMAGGGSASETVVWTPPPVTATSAAPAAPTMATPAP